MRLPKIHLSDKSISYREFSDQFGEFFVDSYEERRKANMRSEYERLTGRKAAEDKLKKNESPRAKSNNIKSEGSDSGSDAKADIGELEEK